ncbi:uncharacterized protein [Oscarella lobularis]|uniref:uncharacterized protein isoform X2 n=1 Tax=Oscarella lobularis TaxID=121494 RepID=UPI0033137560
MLRVVTHVAFTAIQSAFAYKQSRNQTLSNACELRTESNVTRISCDVNVTDICCGDVIYINGFYWTTPPQKTLLCFETANVTFTCQNGTMECLGSDSVSNNTGAPPTASTSPNQTVSSTSSITDDPKSVPPAACCHSNQHSPYKG